MSPTIYDGPVVGLSTVTQVVTAGSQYSCCKAVTVSTGSSPMK